MANRFDFYSAGHSYHMVMNPTSVQKCLELGYACGLEARRDAPGYQLLLNQNLGQYSLARVPRSDGEAIKEVLDVGCGKGALAFLWAENFYASCVGVDKSEGEIEQARGRMETAVRSEMVEFALGGGAEFVDHVVRSGRKFDVATCIGATFVFGSFEKTVKALGGIIHEDGAIAIGEAILNDEYGAEEFRKTVLSRSGLELKTADELLVEIESLGYDLTYMQDSGSDDWDRYEALQWYALHENLRRHPDDPAAREWWLRKRVDKLNYLKDERKYLGWRIFVLRPIV